MTNPLRTIAHYRIISKLGEGGMGEVWHATDTKLRRDVAIKILPEAFARDPERLARFAREASVLASLNHPNIAVIHGLEENAIVMELVEGRTLSEHISGKPTAVPEALGIARQVVDALEYAHERGVVHRDLKPANVKITPEGRVKVLDFGLAKALSVEHQAAQNPADTPTLTLSGTEAGVVLGTPGYMSPEQARGLPADKRTDIWAFGAVVYEMLTGKKAFPGATLTDSLASILKSDPDWTALPAGTPGPVQRLIERCLDKDVKRRLRDIGEARIILEQPMPR